jgi:hypothetical protein
MRLLACIAQYKEALKFLCRLVRVTDCSKHVTPTGFCPFFIAFFSTDITPLRTLHTYGHYTPTGLVLLFLPTLHLRTLHTYGVGIAFSAHITPTDITPLRGFVLFLLLFSLRTLHTYGVGIAFSAHITPTDITHLRGWYCFFCPHYTYGHYTPTGLVMLFLPTLHLRTLHLYGVGNA